MLHRFRYKQPLHKLLLIHKHIAKGKSANNLSGSYISAAFTGGYAFNMIPKNNLTDVNGQRMGTTLSLQHFEYALKWGHQWRLFKNGYADFSVSPLWKDYLKMKSGTNKIYDKEKLMSYPKTDFKIGFAF